MLSVEIFHTPPLFLLTFKIVNMPAFLLPLLTAGAQTASNFLTSGVTNARNRKLQAEQIAANEKAATTAYNRQMAFYSKQFADTAAYNDPAAVRERYEAAGINPNAAFGTAGSYSPTNAPGLSHVSAAQAAPVPYIPSRPLSTIDPLDSALKQAQIDNINADTVKKQGESIEPGLRSDAQRLTNSLTEQRIINERVKNDQDSFDLSFARDTRESNIDKLRQSVVNMESQARNLDATYQVLLDQHSNNPTVVAEIESRIFKNDLQAAILNVQLQYQGRINQAQIDKLLSEVSNLSDLRTYIQAQTVTEMFSADLKEAQAKVAAMESSHATDRYGNAMDRIRQLTSAIGSLLSGTSSVIRSVK